MINQKEWKHNHSSVWREIVSRFGQADYDDETKRAGHEATLKLEWDAQEYSRNRAAEYPDTGSQFNKIYDDENVFMISLVLVCSISIHSLIGRFSSGNGSFGSV